MDKVDAVVMAVRNRLPGLDTGEWVAEIGSLGQLVARNVVAVHTGDEPTGNLVVEDLIYAGMAEDVAHRLIPDASPAEGYVELWRRLEQVRQAARLLAAPPVVEALPDLPIDPPRRADLLGQLTAVLFGPTFVTLEEAMMRVPRVSDLLAATMALMSDQRAQQRAVADLDAAGWSHFGSSEATELVFGHPAMGVLVLATAESRRRTVQATLDRIMELGAPYIQVVLDRGVQPVRVVHRTTDGGRACWALDGVPQPPGRPLPACIPDSVGLVSGMVRSLVGHLRARFLGLENPPWSHCSSCGSPRVEAARLEVERGRSTFVVDDDRGEFLASDGGAHLRLVGRKVEGTQVIGRMLRCPDCLVARAFPNERPVGVSSFPRNMAGDPPPQGVLELLQQQTGKADPLPAEALPEGIDEWLRGAEPGASSQFADLRLVWQPAFRLPDHLVDLARSLNAQEGAENVWRDAVDRVGRDQPWVLAWEIRDLDAMIGTAQKVLLMGAEPDQLASVSAGWFGPVEEWIEVMPGMCWRGTLVGSGAGVDLLIIQDFLGSGVSFGGGGVDFEYLQGQVQKAACIVYVGNGQVEWDDDGVQWAADEGKLCAVIAPAAQLANADPPEGVAWIDVDAPDALKELHAAVDRTVDPEIRVVLRELRRVMENVELSIPAGDMAEHLCTSELKSAAVLAELTDSPESWFYLLDAILAALGREGIGSTSEVRFRASVAGRLLGELGLPAVVTEKWWSLIEFHERTGVGRDLVRWLQPMFREHPDRMLLARVRAVAERMPDLSERYTELLELRGATQNRRRVHVRRPVFEFWWGVGAPSYWRSRAGRLPDLLGLAPQAICGKATVLVAGGPIREGRRLATLITGADALIESAIPEPSIHTPAIVLEPANVDLLRLEARNTACNLTVIVSSSPAEHWAKVLPKNVAVVPMTTEMTAPSPGSATLARRLRAADGGDTAEIASLMHIVRLKKGTRVLEAGKPVGGAAWIRSGEVQLADQVLGPDRLLAPEALFHHPVAFTDAVALGDVELDVLSLSALHVLLDAKRPLFRYIERACATELALLLGPGSLSDPWLSPTVRKPTKIDAEWALYWPLVQRNGFHDLEAIDLAKTFRHSWAGQVSAGDLLYAPGAESDDLMLVLDGELVVDDGVRKVTHTTGSILGHLQLLPGHRAEKCTAIRDTTVLVLADGPEPIWKTPHPALRRAVLRNLRRAWHQSGT